MILGAVWNPAAAAKLQRPYCFHCPFFARDSGSGAVLSNGGAGRKLLPKGPRFFLGRKPENPKGTTRDSGSGFIPLTQPYQSLRLADSNGGSLNQTLEITPAGVITAGAFHLHFYFPSGFFFSFLLKRKEKEEPALLNPSLFSCGAVLFPKKKKRKEEQPPAGGIPTAAVLI